MHIKSGLNGTSSTPNVSHPGYTFTSAFRAGCFSCPVTLYGKFFAQSMMTPAFYPRSKARAWSKRASLDAEGALRRPEAPTKKRSGPVRDDH